MTWFKRRIESIEQRLAPTREKHFVVVVDGLRVSDDGNWLPYVPDPDCDAEVVFIRPSPSSQAIAAENARWWAEHPGLREALTAREVLEEDTKAIPPEDYTSSLGQKLPEEYFPEPPKPAQPDHKPSYPEAHWGGSVARIVPEDWAHANETVAEMFKRLGF